jgi:hypothetical protein
MADQEDPTPMVELTMSLGRATEGEGEKALSTAAMSAFIADSRKSGGESGESGEKGLSEVRRRASVEITACGSCGVFRAL